MLRQAGAFFVFAWFCVGSASAQPAKDLWRAQPRVPPSQVVQAVLIDEDFDGEDDSTEEKPGADAPQEKAAADPKAADPAAAEAGGKADGAGKVAAIDHVTPGSVYRLDRAQGGHTLTVSDLDVSPDGRWLASVGRDRSLRIWNLATGERAHRIHAHGNWCQTVRYSPDGKLLATGGLDRRIRFWNPLTGDPQGELTEHLNGVHALAFSPDGGRLVSGGRDKLIRIWNLARREQTAELPVGDGWIQSIEFIAAEGPPRFATLAGRDRPLRVWSLDQAELSHAIEAFARPEGTLQTMRASPDGRTMAVGVANLVELWHPLEKMRMLVLAAHTADVAALAYSPDGRLLATGGVDNRIHIWEVDTGKQLAALDGHRGWVSSLVWTRDMKHLVSGSADASIIVWNVPTALWYRQNQPAAPDADACWKMLASANPTEAYFALYSLAADPERAHEQLHARLKPATAMDDPLVGVHHWLDQLDHDEFHEREQAARRLQGVLPDLHSLLEERLRQTDSEEVRVRLRRLLAQEVATREQPADVLRLLRSIQLLERIADVRAVALLETLASGAAGARSTQDARRAVSRLRLRRELLGAAPAVPASAAPAAPSAAPASEEKLKEDAPAKP